MPKRREGSVATLPDGRYQGVITLNNGKRHRMKPPFPKGTSYAEAKRLTKQASDYARAHNLVPEQKPTPQGDPELNMAAWVALWAELRRARKQTAVRKAEEHYRNHVVPVLGDRHIADWRREHLEDLVAALDRKVAAGTMAWKQAKNIWGTVTSMLGDAYMSKSRELRCRDDNPAKSVRGPDRGAKKAKVILYPDELLQLAACEAVPLAWRRIVTVAIYTYLRAGELRALSWPDVDLEHGVLHIHRAWNAETKRIEPTKGKAARRVPIEPALMPLLVAMKNEALGGTLVTAPARGKDEAPAGATDGTLYASRSTPKGVALASCWSGRAPAAPDGHDRLTNRARLLFPNMGAASKLSTWLRSRLLQAAVDRAELHDTDSATTKAMTFHDLRTTGITWRAVRGDEPLQIQLAAGHTDFKTTQGYIQMASALRGGFGAPFPELPAALLGGGEHGAHAATHRGPDGVAAGPADSKSATRRSPDGDVGDKLPPPDRLDRQAGRRAGSAVHGIPQGTAHHVAGPAIAKCTRTVEHVTTLDAATALSAAAGGNE